MNNTVTKDEMWEKRTSLSSRAQGAAVEQKTPYDDDVTPEKIAQLNKIVSDDEFVGYKVISGPGW